MTNAKVPMGAPMPPACSLAPAKRLSSAGNLVLAAGLAGGFALGLSASLPAMAAPEVGVAAAVNPNARGTPPGGGPRTLVLGDNIIHRERIQTQGEGLVQVLLVDGSTFTVGPNSDLVIDEFVYDPNAGQGKLVASFSKGVARFVGGKLSKNPGGVTVNTPVGTIGIRGGIANLNMTGNAPTFSLIFGDELTFSGTNGGHRRIYERGYTMELGAGGTVLVRRTRPQDLGRVQRQLISRRGQTGGARRSPRNDDVNRGVSQNNSRLGYSSTTPPPKPDVVLASRIRDVDAGGNETNDTNKRTIDTDTRPTPLGPGSFRVLTAGDTYVVAGGGPISDPGAHGLVGGSSDADRTVIGDLFDGNIATINAAQAALVTTAGITVDGTAFTLPIGLADYGAEPTTGSAFWLITGRTTDVDETNPPPWSASADTFSGLLPSQEYLPAEAITHAGFLWSGAENFAFAALFPETGGAYMTTPPTGDAPGASETTTLDASDPIYFLTGTGTDFSQYLSQSEEDAHIRTYALSGDPREMLTQALFGSNPYENNLFMVAETTVDALGDAFVSRVGTSGLIVVEPDDIAVTNPKFMDVSFLIDGTGTSQQSAVSVIAGDITQLGGDGAWALTGTRRGGVRAVESALLASGGEFSSLSNAEGDHVFGPDAENFVLGFDVDNNGAFSDSSPDSGAFASEAFGTIHVAELKTKELKSDYAAYRGTGTLLGYGAGLAESSVTTGATAFTGYDPLDLVVQFDATHNTVGVEMGILNADLATQFIETHGEGSPEFDGIGSFEFAFGQGVRYEDYPEDTNPQNGGNAYVDNDTYAAVENPNKLRNSLNYWDTNDYMNDTSYGQSEDTTSQNYFISGNAVPEADAALFQSNANPGAPEKCACEFMHWGYWGARHEADGTGEDAIAFDTDGKRRDYFHLSTWVAGDLPDTGTIRDLGSATATYSGHAIGNVERIDGSQTSRYLATGALDVNWNFGTRAGTLSITDFDEGRFSASTAINDTVTDRAAVNRFQGTDTSGGATFTANGSFASSTSDVVGGVLGSFSYREDTGNYTAAGTFIGERNSD